MKNIYCKCLRCKYHAKRGVLCEREEMIVLNNKGICMLMDLRPLGESR